MIIPKDLEKITQEDLKNTSHSIKVINYDKIKNIQARDDQKFFLNILMRAVYLR